MTDPKNTEDQELSLDQLKDAAGGAAFMKREDIKGEYRQIVHPQYRDRVSGTSGPGGTSFPKDNLLGSADPGLDDI